LRIERDRQRTDYPTVGRRLPAERSTATRSPAGSRRRARTTAGSWSRSCSARPTAPRAAAVEPNGRCRHGWKSGRA